MRTVNILPVSLKNADFRNPPDRYISDSSMLNVCSSSSNCSSARCASDNVACREVDKFGSKIVSLQLIL
jgi:hypothetical protein